MALQMTTTFKGLTVENAYFRIPTVHAQKTGFEAVVEVKANETSEPLFRFNVFIPADNMHLDGSDLDRNLFKQAFEYIKVQDNLASEMGTWDFTGATDV